jgi:hypothetical protein
VSGEPQHSGATAPRFRGLGYDVGDSGTTGRRDGRGAGDVNSFAEGVGLVLVETFSVKSLKRCAESRVGRSEEFYDKARTVRSRP